MESIKKLHIKKANSGICTGTEWISPAGSKVIESISPVDGRIIAKIQAGGAPEYKRIITQAQKAFPLWRKIPAPERGEIVRQIGEALRKDKENLGRMICLEMGKSLQEGYGEVQEMIDVCDFAVGQSRMLYGATMPSERPSHRLYDQYHPLGVVGIITAFNFPAAVWAWNAMLSTVCGNVLVWKPSSQVGLTAIAIQHIIARVLKKNKLPEGIFSLICGSGKDIGDLMLADTRLPLISFTGSVRTGRHAAQIIAGRLGKSLLELGGNNSIIISPEADLAIAIPAVVFGAVGTAGQRCTTTRRLIIHESIYDKVRDGLTKAYKSLRIGSPLNQDNHMGPLVNQDAVANYLAAVETIKDQGGEILCGGHALQGEGFESGCYVAPTLVEVKSDIPIIKEETFAPILYLIRYSGDINQAIEINNSAHEGLSSAIFSNNLREAETFLSPWGSDCGIANVNIGTSGAEIGGAFGGEKDTGGGRESGSDAWKAYMRRQTVTINYGHELPLAQGINFTI
ncbi:L-piperidine-6-carboxylate dehydrogenase [Desulfotalea psychrophila]|nr:aldehyde dehydrogenase family protein [Desulfotalea psychrophila]